MSNEHVHPAFAGALADAHESVSAAAAITATGQLGFVRYEISGTLRTVNAAVQDLLRRFPAEGYGTLIIRLHDMVPHCIAVVTRSANCD